MLQMTGWGSDWVISAVWAQCQVCPKADVDPPCDVAQVPKERTRSRGSALRAKAGASSAIAVLLRSGRDHAPPQLVEPEYRRNLFRLQHRLPPRILEPQRA